MKKKLLLLSVIACFSMNTQAQCPTKIEEPVENGTRYDLTLSNISQCPLATNTVIPIGSNTTGYLSGYCDHKDGDPDLPIVLEVTHNSGTLIVLSAQTSNITIAFSGNNCTYNSAGNLITLPVELIEFTGTPSVLGNVLTWTTASESNNSRFDIERSTDGTTFHNIGQVKGNNKPSSYQFVDHQPFATTYYRLRQIDNDGTETYSKIISLQSKDKTTLKVYPSVTTGFLTIETNETADYQVFNCLGQQVLNHATSARFKTSPTLIDVSALPQGTYILKVGAEQAKFLKQ